MEAKTSFKTDLKEFIAQSKELSLPTRIVFLFFCFLSLAVPCAIVFRGRMAVNDIGAQHGLLSSEYASATLEEFAYWFVATALFYLLGAISFSIYDSARKRAAAQQRAANKSTARNALQGD